MPCDGKGHRLIDCCDSGALRALPVPDGPNATHIERSTRGGDLHLCECCYTHELAWRKAQNHFLLSSAKFALPTWAEAPLVSPQLRPFHRLTQKRITFHSGRFDGAECIVQDWVENVTGRCFGAMLTTECSKQVHAWEAEYEFEIDVFEDNHAVDRGEEPTKMLAKIKKALIVNMHGEDVIVLDDDLVGAEVK